MFNFQGCLDNVSKMLQEFFKGVSRVYPEDFKDGSRKFKDNFSGV